MFETKKLSESELASVTGGKRVSASISSMSERATHGLAGVDVGGFGEPGGDRLKDRDRVAILPPTTN